MFVKADLTSPLVKVLVSENVTADCPVGTAEDVDADVVLVLLLFEVLVEVDVVDVVVVFVVDVVDVVVVFEVDVVDVVVVFEADVVVVLLVLLVLTVEDVEVDVPATVPVGPTHELLKDCEAEAGVVSCKLGSLCQIICVRKELIVGQDTH